MLPTEFTLILTFIGFTLIRFGIPLLAILLLGFLIRRLQMAAV